MSSIVGFLHSFQSHNHLKDLKWQFYVHSHLKNASKGNIIIQTRFKNDLYKKQDGKKSRGCIGGRRGEGY